MTPEGKVKAKVKRVLDHYGVYYFMPVQMGLGAAGVDFHCAVAWGELSIAFFIETKPPEGELTERQELFLNERREKQKAKVFVIKGDWGIKLLVQWLESLKDGRQG